MDVGPLSALSQLHATWHGELGPARRRATAAAVVGALVGGLHLARQGTGEARAAVGVLLALGTLVLLGLAARRRWGRRDPRAIIDAIVTPADPPLGAAALRALDLHERSSRGEDVGSPALVSLHLQRIVGRARPETIRARAHHVAARWSLVGLLLALFALFATVIEPTRIIEGANILAARDGLAPVPMTWLGEVAMDAKPPAYLHRSDGGLRPFRDAQVPVGTVITVRGLPSIAGRSIVLVLPDEEVPFVDDGQGGLVTHYTVKKSTELAIGARFGDVLIRQIDTMTIDAIADAPPDVVLEGAPRVARLLDEPNISIRYEAKDDHGLREVNLVLRSGAREERRVLSRPSGDKTSDRGGYELRSSDAFFRKTHAPVEVTVEARDNDPVTGPKWGRSPAIQILPPAIGEPEALRLAALTAARDALTDVLAARLAPYTAKTKAEIDAHLADERAAHERVRDIVTRALTESFAGKRVKGRAAKLAKAQLERLEKGLLAEKKSRSKAGHTTLVEETERVLLAYDSTLAALATIDARAVAKRLSEVAEESAASSALAIDPAERDRGLLRLEAANLVLGMGGKELSKLGELGRDLGEVTLSDLRRIERAKNASDFVHAELAALDLAARLKKAEPSFQGGGGGGEGGVESGSGGERAPDEADPSNAEDEAESLEKAIADLVREHQKEMGEVARALDQATESSGLDELREAAKEHAEKIREAARALPRSGGRPGSAESAAAAARDLAEGMASALEGGRLGDAVDSGNGASKRLEEASQKGDKEGSSLADKTSGAAAKEAQKTIEKELMWAQKALEQLQKKVSERAQKDLQKQAEKERGLAERTRQTMERGDSGEGAMPGEMRKRLDEAEQKMREAEQKLGEGKGAEGLEKQREAQRLLEMALGEQDEKEEGEDSPTGKEGPPSRAHADIPDKDKYKGPLAFRKRVMEGLAAPSEGHLKDAVKRYAEGLLR